MLFLGHPLLRFMKDTHSKYELKVCLLGFGIDSIEASHHHVDDYSSICEHHFLHTKHEVALKHFRAVMTLANNSTLQLQSGNRWSDVCDVRGREMHVQARVCVSTPRTREHNATAGGGEDDLATY